MKKRYIGLVLIALLFFNCDSGSNGNDDDFLNGSNYISENNFYIFYLNSEIDLLQADIDELQAIIDSGMGDSTTQADLDEAIVDQNVLIDELDLAYLNSNPVPLNTPPSECPEAITCFPVDASYLVMHNRFSNLEINIFNDQGDVIFSSTNEVTLDLPGVNDYKYVDINIDPYTGPVTLIVIKTDSSNNIITYFISGYAY